jgi:hypothetical protein
MRISTFIISLLIASMIVVGFVALYAKTATTYNVDYGDNISELDQYNNLSIMTNDIRTNVASEKKTSGGFAIIGDFLSNGYDAVRFTFDSINIFNGMLNAARDNIPFGDETGTLDRFKLVIGMIVFIAFIFIVISILINRQNL